MYRPLKGADEVGGHLPQGPPTARRSGRHARDCKNVYNRHKHDRLTNAAIIAHGGPVSRAAERRPLTKQDKPGIILSSSCPSYMNVRIDGEQSGVCARTSVAL